MIQQVKTRLKPNEHGARLRALMAVLAVTTLLLIWQFPDQAWVLLSKLNRIALGAFLGIAIDRAVFWYARPSAERLEMHWQYRRLALTIGGMMAAALAL